MDRNLKEWLGASYGQIGIAARHSREKLFSSLLDQRRVPDEGWSPDLVQEFILWLSSMDSNNQMGISCAGEREGRVFSSTVKRRHFNLAHGVGRSGDILAKQPKAVGSSLLNHLASTLATDIIRRTCHIEALKHAVVFPVATGLGLAFCLSTLAARRPKAKLVVLEDLCLLLVGGPASPLPYSRRKVVLSRMDQKSTLKAVQLANLDLHIVSLVENGDALQTSVKQFENIIRQEAENIVAVVGFTSVFAPREPDDVVALAKISRTGGVPLVVNNAYGLQCDVCCSLIQKACTVGRVDFVVQSTDKNFLVPVGGSIIASPDKVLLSEVTERYPGRASASPQLDFLITLLEMGAQTYLSLRQRRHEIAEKTRQRLRDWCASFPNENFRLLETPRNTISFAISLKDRRMTEDPWKTLRPEDYTFFGSSLYTRRLTGPRVVVPWDDQKKSFGLGGFGSHNDEYPHAYFTIAAAIGMTENECEIVLARLRTVTMEWLKKSSASNDRGRPETENKLPVEDTSIQTDCKATARSWDR